ncbi:hypothetical protein PR371_00665 [Mycobacterium marinum]|uniref:hypothetical protein n=1 Tax=Mycobacterium marinum TaxID=1781 RepID=UPI00233FA827|nr:hypothetical protein [Mycobacterium marinum]MDC8992492.1 hypothetical protein [Mycobacterium marinum]WDZ15793.1 hypothetical protein PQR73_009700 [Mycobacterium marinum]
MTTSYNVEIVLELERAIDADMEAHLDDVAEALADITDVDGDVGMNVATGRVDLCMTVLAESQSEAIGRAISAARTAIHTAGGGTPGWDGMLQKVLENDEFCSKVAPSSLGLELDCPA